MTNSAVPDPKSGSTLLAKTGHFVFSKKTVRFRKIPIYDYLMKQDALIFVVSRFSYISRLKVKFDKTYALWIGLNKLSSSTIKSRWKLACGKSEFNLLGITFHVILNKVNKLTMKTKYKKGI